jgi:hypothetical protein
VVQRFCVGSQRPVVVGSGEVDVFGHPCPYAESQLECECSLKNPAAWLRDGEPGEEALKSNALSQSHDG